MREQNALPDEGWITINLTAKPDVDNIGAGRAAKGASPFVRTSKSINFDEKFVDFIFIGELHLFDCYGIINKK